MENLVDHGSTGSVGCVMPAACWIWSVPFHPLRYDEVVDLVDDLITVGRPTFFITANLNYVMIAHRCKALDAVNRRATFVIADGITLVWASRWKQTPLPERVTGSDLIYGLSDLAARRGYRVFLLGGGPSVAEEAARNLTARYPGLRIVGVESPPFRPLDAAETEALECRSRQARPDLLLVSFGQPKGELWISERLDRLAVPVSVHVSGAAIDFAAGRVRRAEVGAEDSHGDAFPHPPGTAPGWPRYLRNALFLSRKIAAYLWRTLRARVYTLKRLRKTRPSLTVGRSGRP